MPTKDKPTSKQRRARKPVHGTILNLEVADQDASNLNPQEYSFWRDSVGIIEKTVQNLKINIGQLHAYIEAKSSAFSSPTTSKASPSPLADIDIYGTLSAEVLKQGTSVPTSTVLKSGVVDGMAYTVYSDGSIEAMFGSIAQFRNYIEHTVAMEPSMALHHGRGSSGSASSPSVKQQHGVDIKGWSPLEGTQSADPSAGDWAEVKNMALKIIEADKLETPSAHLAYLRNRLSEALQDV